MKPRLEGALASAILKNVTAGLALFGEGLDLVWCNQSFKKQTWFGGAQGGKNAVRVGLFDLFERKDHAAVIELFNIAGSLGQAYDFQRTVRRGPMGAFPAELKLHRLEDDQGRRLVCLEIRDLSLNKLYDELEASHTSMRERVSDLMTAQAELHYSVRMNTISEIGADMAHSLINPITMCRDIVEKELAPLLPGARTDGGPDAGGRGAEGGEGGGGIAAAGNAHPEVEKLLRYLKSIEDLAVWFRKFSNPRLSDMQISNVASLVDDALILNSNRFSRLGVNTEVDRRVGYNPFVLAVPVNLIMWLNAAFAELSGGLPQGCGRLRIHVGGNGDTVHLGVSGELAEGAHERLLPHTLEKFARRLPASARFVWEITPVRARFELQLACFAENERDEAARSLAKHETALEVAAPRLPAVPAGTRKDGEHARPVTEQHADGPCVLVVDDEKDIRRLLKRAFRNLGLEAIEASDGKEALSLFTTASSAALASKVRVIVSDVRMPEMTGITFFKDLRAAGNALPFVFFSSNLVDPEEVGGAGEPEGVHMLTKESDVERLKQLVMAYVSKAGAKD